MKNLNIGKKFVSELQSCRNFIIKCRPECSVGKKCHVIFTLLQVGLEFFATKVVNITEINVKNRRDLNERILQGHFSATLSLFKTNVGMFNVGARMCSVFIPYYSQRIILMQIKKSFPRKIAHQKQNTIVLSSFCIF